MATYAELMGVLGALYGADADALRGQMRGRVQNLQKLGMPLGLGSKMGRGRKIDYQRPEIYQMVFAMELAELGLMPGQIASVIKLLWDDHVLGHFRSEWSTPSKEDDLFLCLNLNCMSWEWERIGTFNLIADAPKTKNADNPMPFRHLKAIPSKGVPKLLHDWLKNYGVRHVSLINVSALVREAEARLIGVLPAPGAKNVRS